MGARFYSPGTGRFTGRDPIIGSNLYTYCKNNPINYVDPLGYAEEGSAIDQNKRLPEEYRVNRLAGSQSDSVDSLLKNAYDSAKDTVYSLLLLLLPESSFFKGIKATLKEREILQNIDKLTPKLKESKPGTNPGELKEIVKYSDEAGKTRVVIHQVRIGKKIIHCDIKAIITGD